jgi:hypothetical protein
MRWFTAVWEGRPHDGNMKPNGAVPVATQCRIKGGLNITDFWRVTPCRLSADGGIFVGA